MNNFQQQASNSDHERDQNNEEINNSNQVNNNGANEISEVAGSSDLNNNISDSANQLEQELAIGMLNDIGSLNRATALSLNVSLRSDVSNEDNEISQEQPSEAPNLNPTYIDAQISTSIEETTSTDSDINIDLSPITNLILQHQGEENSEDHESPLRLEDLGGFDSNFDSNLLQINETAPTVPSIDEQGIDQNDQHNAMLSTGSAQGASRNRTLSNYNHRYPLSNEEVLAVLQEIKNYLIEDIINNNESVNNAEEAIQLAMNPSSGQWNNEAMAALRFLEPNKTGERWGKYDLDVMNNDNYGDNNTGTVFNLQRLVALSWRAANDKELVKNGNTEVAKKAILQAMFTSQRAYNLDEESACMKNARDKAACPPGTCTRIALALKGLHRDCVTVLQPKSLFMDELPKLFLSLVMSNPELLQLFYEGFVQQEEKELEDTMTYCVYNDVQEELLGAIKKQYPWNVFKSFLIKKYDSFNSKDPKSDGMVDERTLKELQRDCYNNKGELLTDLRIFEILRNSLKTFNIEISHFISRAKQNYGVIPKKGVAVDCSKGNKAVIVNQVNENANNHLALDQIQTPGIGQNCMFRAAIMGMYHAGVLQGLGLNHETLRQNVSNEIRSIGNDPTHCLYENLRNGVVTTRERGYTGNTVEAYAQWIGRPGNWGGDFELAVIARMYNLRIEIYPTNNPHPLVHNPNGTATIRVHQTGNHYNLLVPTNSWQPPANNHPMMVKYHQDMALIDEIASYKKEKKSNSSPKESSLPNNTNSIGKNKNGLFGNNNNSEDSTEKEKNTDEDKCVIL